MKKHILRDSLIFASLLLLLMGCLDGAWQMKDEALSGRTVLSVKEAMEYFNAHVTELHQSPPNVTRSIDEEALMTLLWERGKKVAFKKKEVIEVPINTGITIVHSYDPLAKNDTNKKKYPNTIYRLIADRQDDGSYVYTIVRITLDDAYLLARKKSRKSLNISVGNLNGFTGCIRYYTTNGEFLTGNNYVDGVKKNVISSSDIVPQASIRPAVVSRSHIECVEHVYEVAHYSCTDVYVEGELMSQSCELDYVDYEVESVCDLVPDEDDGEVGNEDDDNKDDSGSGGGNRDTIPRYRDIDVVAANPDVVKMTQDVWGAVLSSLSVEKARREVGCYVYYNPATGKYVNGILKYGDYVTGNIGTNASVQPGNASPNSNGVDRNAIPVTFVHGHTPLSNEEDCQRPVGPSKGDQEWCDSNGIGGIVIDYVGAYDYDLRVNIIVGGHNPNDKTKLYIIKPKKK